MDAIIRKVFEGNKKWIEDMMQKDPDFFAKRATEQKPPILWIGCSDSRVPANEITRTLPGEIFVHRNIANMIVNTDLSMLSVVDYAVNVLGISDIIVCGHYGCGGVSAALSDKPFGLVDNWLRNIKDVYRLHQEELDRIADPEKRNQRLVELNTIEQAFNLSKTFIVQNAWRRGQPLEIHALVYDLHSGALIDLQQHICDSSALPKFYQLNGVEA